MNNVLTASVAATLIAASCNTFAAPPAKALTLEVLGSYASGIFADGGAEITAYDRLTRSAFVVNAGAGTVDVLDLSDPASPTRVEQLDVGADVTAAVDAPGVEAGSANSVAVRDGMLAVAVENDDKQANGWVAFYATADIAAGLAGVVEVGALPDMVTFTDHGRYVLTANEGEPSDDYTVDPEGSVSVIDLSAGVAGASAMTADFGAFDADALRALGVRIFGPGATAAQDLEPEYITTANGIAYVTLQENNALAVVDIATATVQAVLPLGYKDHSLAGNGLDPSNRDDGINIRPWTNVLGMYQPDSIASYQHRGQTLLVTANEGDARDYDGFSEEARGKALFEKEVISEVDVPGISDNEELGRLNSTTEPPFGDTSNLYAYGARSFSIWSADGTLVWDSGDALEQLTADIFPDDFNSTNDENDSFDNRSDDKGPEPEGVAIGKVEGRTYAFIGLERIGGIVAYDITNPEAPVFMDYLNNRNFSVPTCFDANGVAPDDVDDCVQPNPAAGDLGPEGLHFVSKADSPNGEALLIVGNEVSGTTTVYQINVKPAKARGPKQR
jgi:hypothetical protein